MGLRGKSRTGTAVAAGWVVLTALLCLAFAASRDPDTVSLAKLSADEDSVLMSCAPSSSGDALLWCSDPSSPQCIPAAPSAPRVELADRPDVALLDVASIPPASFVLVPWPRPQRDTNRGTNRVHRLERPPRA